MNKDDEYKRARNMERRRNKRIAAHQYVCIEYPGGKTLTGWTRNVSCDGLFIELDMADLPAHSLAQLLVPIEDEETGSYRRIPVAVTRHSREGIGLLYWSNAAEASGIEALHLTALLQDP